MQLVLPRSRQLPNRRGGGDGSVQGRHGLGVVAEEGQRLGERLGRPRVLGRRADRRRGVLVEQAQPVDQAERELGLGLPRLRAQVPLARAAVAEVAQERRRTAARTPGAWPAARPGRRPRRRTPRPRRVAADQAGQVPQRVRRRRRVDVAGGADEPDGKRRVRARRAAGRGRPARPRTGCSRSSRPATSAARSASSSGPRRPARPRGAPTGRGAASGRGRRAGGPPRSPGRSSVVSVQSAARGDRRRELLVDVARARSRAAARGRRRRRRPRRSPPSRCRAGCRSRGPRSG